MGQPVTTFKATDPKAMMALMGTNQKAFEQTMAKWSKMLKVLTGYHRPALMLVGEPQTSVQLKGTRLNHLGRKASMAVFEISGSQARLKACPPAFTPPHPLAQPITVELDQGGRRFQTQVYYEFFEFSKSVYARIKLPPHTTLVTEVIPAPAGFETIEASFMDSVLAARNFEKSRRMRSLA